MSTQRKRPSILDHGALPEDRAVGRLRRDGGLWDWDEHRATYDQAAARAMVLFRDLSSISGLEAAIARGLFCVATSNDEDHFAIRAEDGESCAYKWPTVPAAEYSRDVVLISAFLGGRAYDEALLEPQDIPLAMERARIIGRNVPVLICIVNDEGLSGRRFQLRPQVFERLMKDPIASDFSENDVTLSRWVNLLPFDDLAARFKELASERAQRQRRGPLRAALARLSRAVGER